jgi:PleD family two-component response regulator
MRQKKFYEEIPIELLPTAVFVNAKFIPRTDALRTALVVDDDRKNADSLVAVLRTNGYLAEAAYSGEEGLARAKELRPGVIISDVGLPKMDGITMVDSINGFLQREDRADLREPTRKHGDHGLVGDEKTGPRDGTAGGFKVAV